MRARLAAADPAERVSIVHARSRAPAWSAWLACRRTGAHFVTTYHGTYGEDLPFKRHYNAVMAKGERVIAASRFIAELIVARHGVDPARIRVIPRGVDPGGVRSGSGIGRSDRTAGATRGGCRTAAPVVLLPGRLTSWKGQAVLIEALARMPRRDVRACWWDRTRGGGATPRGLIRQAEALGVADRLRLAGECDDMPAALMLADVVVHASTQPGGVRPGGDRGAGDGASGDRLRSRRAGGDGRARRHRLARAARRCRLRLAAAIERRWRCRPRSATALGDRARAAVLRGYTVAAMQAATLDVYREIMALA